MFAILVEYLRPLDEIDALVPAHRAFLKTQYDAGVFLLSGPQVPRTGGLILARGLSREALEALTQQDPFYQAGAARYQIIEFAPNLSADALSFLRT
ncbi:YciI family protein [Jeongeupia wiesaeckerbachi]|uniref:YciI family protein n=1 Tax=Jeongeupia wiesaeckerbachi TaxID=3051218 RepID=UPI003D8099F0